MKSALAYNKDYAFNAICPYYTMFPLEYPMGIIKKYRRENPIILDPFCGRGTTIYAARKFDLRSYGLDTSSIAASIAQAKVASAKSDAVLELAKNLLATAPRDVPETEFFQRAFARAALAGACAGIWRRSGDERRRARIYAGPRHGLGAGGRSAHKPL